MPIVVYRVYADGRPDELVRGADIVGTPLESFSKILATSDRPEVFNGYCGAESGSVPVSAISPAHSGFGDRDREEVKSQDRPPLLPMPDLGVRRCAVKRRAASGYHPGAGGLRAACRVAGRRCDPARHARRTDSFARHAPGEPRATVLHLLLPGRWRDLLRAATLGGIVSSRRDRFRLPEVEVRVGDYKFDNTNYAGGGMFGSHFDVSRFPLENDYAVLRRYLWLSTDSAYKVGGGSHRAEAGGAEEHGGLRPTRRLRARRTGAARAGLRTARRSTKRPGRPWRDRFRRSSAAYPKIKDSGVEANVTAERALPGEFGRDRIAVSGPGGVSCGCARRAVRGRHVAARCGGVSLPRRRPSWRRSRRCAARRRRWRRT